MTQTRVSHRNSVALALVATLLVAVAAGAFMLTCTEDAYASGPSPSHEGAACALHEGHVASDVGVVTLPDRSDVSDLAVVDTASFQFAPSAQVEVASSAVVQLPIADPLCGRLLL